MLIPVPTLVRSYGVRPKGVLHLGANIGEEARAYRRARWSPVWWVEARPAAAAQCRRNVKRHPGHHVIEALLGEHEGQSETLHVASNGQSSSVLALGTHATEHPDVTYTGEDLTLPTHTVDMLVATHGIAADYVSLDLQGYELAVLKGAVRFLSQVRWVYAEVNERELYLGCPLVDEMDDYLALHGFTPQATEMLTYGWGDRLYVRSA